jgi:very-short-patch-repair endonuclease
MYLSAKGLRVLRFWDHEIFLEPEQVLMVIQEALTID